LLLRTHMMPDSNVTAHGYVTVVAFPGTDQLCYMGYGESLEPNLVSFLSGGSDCNVNNGCGTHVQAGNDCAIPVKPPGHWYNRTSGMSDPWELLGYTSTDSAGVAWYGSCARMGMDTKEFANKPFVLHSNSGSRVSCGLLTADGDSTEISGQSDTTVSPPESGSSNETSKPGEASSALTAVNIMALLLASFIFIAQI